MSVNYIIEVNGLDDWEFGNPLSATAYKVMRKLLYLANKQRFPEQIKVSNTGLCALVGCSENSLIAARQQLIAYGLIDYRGRKKQTPVYTIHYFSNNPDYNRNYCGMVGGINGGMGAGIVGGRDMDRTYGQENVVEDDDTANDNPLTEEGTIGGDHALHNPASSRRSEDVNGRARIFTVRRRPLDADEMLEYSVARTYLQQPQVAQMYGAQMAMMRQLIESDKYPLALVAYAIKRTLRRNGMYDEPLGSPAAYTMRLLDDWQERGLNTVEAVQEDRDDYYHYG